MSTQKADITSHCSAVLQTPPTQSLVSCSCLLTHTHTYSLSPSLSLSLSLSQLWLNAPSDQEAKDSLPSSFTWNANTSFKQIVPF